MYVFAVVRQAGPVQLRAGLNGVCVNNDEA